MREPKRQRLLADDTAEGKMALREVAGALWTRRHFYGRIYMGIGSVAVVALGMTAWFPSYLIRAHGVDPSHVGLRLGTSAVVLGTIGCLSGPLVARWFERRGHADATLRAAAFGMLAMLCGSLAIPLAPNSTTALCIASFIYFIASFPTGIIAAATATATPSRMRGVVAGLYTFSAQLVGYGLGPTAIALVTDKVFGDPKMVGYSMQIVMSVASVIAILMFFPVLRHYRQLTAAHDAEVPPATPNLTSARKGAA
jgi:MFS family permease